MCTYIMTLLPAAADMKRARETYAQFGLGFWEVQNDRPPQVSPEDHYVAANSGYCDCGTALGSGRFPGVAPKNPIDHIPKLRKKGWSGAKIERWLADKLRHPDRHETRHEEELARWLAFIPCLLESGIAQRLGVFVHFYHKERSAKIIHKINRVPLSMVTPELLRNMSDDTLYEFVLDRAAS